jgi:hypothetical protein
MARGYAVLGVDEKPAFADTISETPLFFSSESRRMKRKDVR